MRLIHSLLLAAFSGALLALPFTIHDSSLVAWFALAPIFWLVAQSPTKKSAMILAATFSLVWCGISFLFLWKLVAAGMIALTIYSALFYIGALLAVRRVSRWGPVNAVVATAAIWVFTELVRAGVPVLALPWLLMGHTLVYHDSLRQGADLFGVYGLSAVVVSVNAAIAFAVPHWLPEKFRATPTAPIRSAWKAVCFACILVFGAQLYGMTMIKRIEPRLVEGAPIGVVQGNIAQKLDRSLEEYERNFVQHMKLHESLLMDDKPKPVLVCWAETMVPGAINTDDWGTRFKTFVKNTGVPAFVGANYNLANPKSLGDPYTYNSAYLIDANGEETFHYFKRKLVPFGEYVPLTESLPFMKWLRSVTRDQYLRGEKASPVYELGGYRIAANICVEDIHPDLAREAANNGASLLLNITNDGWFYKNFGPRSHLQAAMLRSVEVRRPVLRVTNTGYTVQVDPLGRSELLVPHETEGTGLARPLLLPAKGADATHLPKTIYARIGEWGVAVVAAFCLLLAWITRWQLNTLKLGS